MNNKDTLLDVIGDTDEKLIPELTEKSKRKSVVKWAALGGALTAAAIACVIFLPKGSNSENIPTMPSDTGRSNVMLLAAAVYPEIPKYPDETAYEDWEEYESVYDAWNDARFALRNQPEGYKDGFDSFFIDSTKAFLTNIDNKNKVYSPLSLYMALGMSAEITEGDTRRQILDVLNQGDIETLRSHSKSIWQANYMDDGMAKCVLATSLWTNDKLTYNLNTVNAVADYYYSSVFTGNPTDSEYSKLMQEWLNEQTDGLMTDYVSEIKMDPEMALTLASTVNYCGKWNEKFDKELTEKAIFHSPDGDIQWDFMNKESGMMYRWGEKYTSISLQLENNGYMNLILPDEGYSPNDLLNDEQVMGLMMNTRDYPNNKYVNVNMSVPKFDVSSSIDLKDGLEALGITDIFDAGKSDFTPLTDSSDKIYLNRAEQDSRVLIDEEGCRATALTVMQYDGAGEPEENVDFVLDRPFIFEIVSATGLPLFVGIVNNPVQ